MRKLVIGLVCMLLVMVSVSIGYAEEIVMWGSTTCQKRMIEPTAKLLDKETGIKATVMGVGDGYGCRHR